MKINKITTMALLLILAAFGYGQSITVTTPNGGENWALGSTRTITWRTTGITSGNVNIILQKEGSRIGVIASNVAYNANSFSWKVGELEDDTEIRPGSTYTVKIKLVGAETEDRSDGDFTISALERSITVVSPNGRENWSYEDAAHTIRWNSTGITEGTFLITLWKSGSLVGTIARDVPATARSFSWNPEILHDPSAVPITTGNLYKVRVVLYGTGVQDESDSTFLISVPRENPSPPASNVITITSPAENDVLHTGNSYEVKWVTPIGIDGTNDEISIWAGGVSNGRFIPIRFMRNSSGEHTFNWQVLASNFHENYGYYKIRILKKSNYRLLAESKRFLVEENPGTRGAPPPSSTSEQRDDLVLGPIYPPDVSLTRISSYGGGGQGSGTRDKYRVTINFRIRNNSGPNRPVIASVPCAYVLYKKKEKGAAYDWRPDDYVEDGVVNSGPRLINLGPFESRSNGEWTRVSVSFDYYFPESEWGVRNGYKYHFRFELRPPDSVNDPASSNNTTRTPVFDNY